MIKENRSVKDLNIIKEVISKHKVIKVGIQIDNTPYVVPLNYGFEVTDDTLILYCNYNLDGEKLDILRENPNVFIEIGDDNIILKAKVEFVDNIYDKIHGLNKILENSTSNNNEFKNKIINNITLIKITCNNFSF